MSRQCPVGQLCFNREIFVVVLLFLVGLVWYGYSQYKSEHTGFQHDSLNHLETAITEQKRRITDIEDRTSPTFPISSSVTMPSTLYPSATTKLDRIYNPLVAPTRTYPDAPVYGLPVNIPTRGYTEEYQQIGALYSQQMNRQGGPRVLPLFGRAIYPGASKWLYYTSTDDYQSVKIPISHNNRKCQGDFGCHELDDGDLVNVTPYPGKFKISLYDLDKPRYLPHVIF